MRTSFIGVVAAGIFAGPIPTLATVLPVANYSMPNGGTGEYVYQDTAYSNCAGNCTTTGAALSGGTGRLTNGVIPTTDWNVNSNSAGWIGWDNAESNGTNPTVTFNFVQSETIKTVSIWYDNSLGYGNVTSPASVSIDGANFALVPNDTEGPQEFTVSGLNLTGNSASLQFFQGAGPWIMIGQVSFSDTAVVPVPASLWLMLSGLTGVGAMARRRRSFRAATNRTRGGYCPAGEGRTSLDAVRRDKVDFE